MRPAALALAGVAAVLAAAAGAVALHRDPPLTEHVLADGPTAELPLAGPVLFGHTWVKPVGGGPDVINTKAGDRAVPVVGGQTLVLSSPWRWKRPPGVRIAAPRWRWHASLPGHVGGPFVALVTAVRPGDVLCTDGETWWTATCDAVRAGNRDARTVALVLLLGVAAVSGLGAARLVSRA